MGGNRICVFAQGARLYKKSRETEQHFFKETIVFTGDLGFEDRLPVWRVTTGFDQSSDIFILVDPDKPAKFHSVHILCLPGYDHEIISRLIVNKKFPVAVENKSSCRILGNVPENIIIGRKYVFIDQDLNIKKPGDENQPDSEEYSYDDQPPVSQNPFHSCLWSSYNNLRCKSHIAFMQGTVIDEHGELNSVINRVRIQGNGIDNDPFDGFIAIGGS